MTRHKTEYRGLIVRKYTPRQSIIVYTDEWHALMRLVGECIKSSGCVTLTTYVEHYVRYRRESSPPFNVLERCNATLIWDDDE